LFFCARIDFVLAGVTLRGAGQTKVFWFFFSKKNTSASL
jgi:hypothetical protein